MLLGSSRVTSFSQLIRRWKLDPDYRGQIAHVELIPGHSAHFAEPSYPLHPALEVRLRDLGIDCLYTHQAAAVDAVRRGDNVISVTATASGKTLSYNIPAVEAILQNPKARSLYLFPTKALAQDQLGKLNDLGFFPQVQIGRAHV